MNNQEALLRFNVAYDAVASTSAPPLEESEVSALMNNAMVNLVMLLGNNKIFDKLLEVTLVEKSGIQSCSVESFGKCCYQSTNTLTNQLLYCVSSHLRVNIRSSLVEINNDWIPCEIINRDVANYYVQSPMNKQIILSPKLLLHFKDPTDKIIPVIFTDNHTNVTLNSATEVFEIVYIKMPNLINLSAGDFSSLCELSEELQQTIVDKAVKLAINATDQDRLKMIMNEQQRAQQQQR